MRRRLPRKAADLVIAGVVLFVAFWYIGRPILRQHIPHKAKPIIAQTLEDGLFDLDDQHGKVVVLDFFATWCEPCMEALPYVEAFAAAHPEVLVVAVDQGEPEQTVRKFAKHHMLKHVILDPGGAIAQNYGVNGFPTLVAIDGRGFVRDRWFGFTPTIAENVANAVSTYPRGMK